MLSCYLLGFTDRTRADRLEASQLAAAASFGVKGWKSKPHTAGHYQTCLLFSIDDFLEKFKVPFPNYIKIDVPRHTMQIFQGASRALARPELREIQVEMTEHGEGRVLLDLLESYGFRIIHRNKRLSGRIADLVFGRATD